MKDFPAVAAPTSEAAADSVNPTEAKIVREQVFEIIKNAGPTGLTDEEIQEQLLLPGNTQRPRRWELSHKQGRIRQSGTRETRYGRQAAVWITNEIPTLLKEEPKQPQQVIITHKRNGQYIREFTSFVRVLGNVQTITFPQSINILSGDTVSIR